jgi:hypothetical protein
MAKGRLQQAARVADNSEEEKMEELLGGNRDELHHEILRH